jgi:hypothetical protein
VYSSVWCLFASGTQCRAHTQKGLLREKQSVCSSGANYICDKIKSFPYRRVAYGKDLSTQDKQFQCRGRGVREELSQIIKRRARQIRQHHSCTTGDGQGD